MLGKTVGKFTKFKVTNCGNKAKWSNSGLELVNKGFGYFLEINSNRVTIYSNTVSAVASVAIC